MVISIISACISQENCEEPFVCYRVSYETNLCMDINNPIVTTKSPNPDPKVKPGLINSLPFGKLVRFKCRDCAIRIN